MNAYKFSTRVSDVGTITLPCDSHLYNTDVEVFVVPANHNESIEQSRFSASDFVRKWQGCIKGLENVSDEELDRIKHDCLKQKYS